MKSSYSEKDVVILLKDITGMIQPLSAEKREKKIQQGIHYSELLPVEYQPTQEYLNLYHQALTLHAACTAQAVVSLAEQIWKEKEGQVTLVSLARAGTPIGILIKRYLQQTYQVDVAHYTISIIRDKGIDKNAMNYILSRHSAQSIQFVDGWIGKGTIARELKKTIADYPKVSSTLAVLADPAQITPLCGTREDFLIPSACLNAPISGLFSRTVYNQDLIGQHDFHGAVYYHEFEKMDFSYSFIEKIQMYFDKVTVTFPIQSDLSGLQEIEQIAQEFKISNLNYIKPGIGETTRVLMRRIPWKVLVQDKEDSQYIGHIKQLCREKQVEIVPYPLIHYRTCGIIQQLEDL